MDNDSNDYSSIYYSGLSDFDSEKEVIVGERGKVIFGLYTKFHYETMYYPLIFSFSFMSGPDHDVEAWFDYYVVYGNNVALSYRRWNFLDQQVAWLKPDIPFYVCILTSSDADECKSRIVETCTYFSYLVSAINIP
jgi:hypothetical protein